LTCFEEVLGKLGVGLVEFGGDDLGPDFDEIHLHAQIFKVFLEVELFMVGLAVGRLFRLPFRFLMVLFWGHGLNLLFFFELDRLGLCLDVGLQGEKIALFLLKGCDLVVYDGDPGVDVGQGEDLLLLHRLDLFDLDQVDVGHLVVFGYGLESRHFTSFTNRKALCNTLIR